MDILVPVLNAVISIALACVGVYVTIHTPRTAKRKAFYKWLLAALALISVCGIAFQAYRNHKSQAELIQELSVIKRNTEKPPTINVNIPPPTVINESAKSKQEEMKPESKNSLRLRTIALAKSINEFWSNRAEMRQKLALTREQGEAYDAESWVLCGRRFKEGLLGTIREFKGKGLDTKYLERGIENNGCFWPTADSQIGDLDYFQSMAYHVDAEDRLVWIEPDEGNPHTTPTKQKK